MSSAVAHVCGHLHTLGNTVFQMYGRHPSGHLELELGDFVGYRRYMYSEMNAKLEDMVLIYYRIVGKFGEH